ncbi:MAG: exodeoxyribonuclease VII large subunit [Bacteroidales bacterium]|jgi:exodeoxyribonuclease VII large subunit
MSSPLTLLELNKNIQSTIRSGFPERVWVIGEISEIKTNRNGHCYFELVEKDAIKDALIAKARGIIWSSIFRLLRPYFEEATGSPLKEGMKVLLLVSVEFHELYGFSLVVYDIDPTYTLGDLAQERERILAQLEEEGILHMNKQALLPRVPQNIAIISSSTAAGYQDFMNQLNEGARKYAFYTKLFPAVMQGQEAESSIIHALDQVYQVEGLFDVVVLIRGGGSQADLSCFNNYNLASNIAQFPLPVLTGIGHDKDESIADRVAHTKLKTPTAVATFLVERAANFEEQLFALEEAIGTQAQKALREGKESLALYSNRLSHASQKQLHGHSTLLTRQLQAIHHKAQQSLSARRYQTLTLTQHIKNAAEHQHISARQHIYQRQIQLKTHSLQRLSRHNVGLQAQEALLTSIDPKNVLKRGYSITKLDGKALKEADVLKRGDIIETTLYKGKIKSKIQ